MAQAYAGFAVEPVSLIVGTAQGEGVRHPLEQSARIANSPFSVPKAGNPTHTFYPSTAARSGNEATRVGYELKTYIAARITITSIDCR